MTNLHRENKGVEEEDKVGRKTGIHYTAPQHQKETHIQTRIQLLETV